MEKIASLFYLSVLIFLILVKEGDLIKKGAFKEHSSVIRSVKRTGDFLITCGGCEELFLWKLSLNSLQIVAKLPQISKISDVRIMDFESYLQGDSLRVWCLYSDSTLRIWDFIDFKASLVYECEVHKGHCPLKCLSSSSSFISTGTDGFLEIRSLDSFEIISTKRVHKSGVNSIIASDSIIITGGDDNSLSCFDTRSNNLESVKAAHFSSITCLAWIDEDNLTFASSSIDQYLKLWHVNRSTMEIELLAEYRIEIADASAMIFHENYILIFGCGFTALEIQSKRV